MSSDMDTRNRLPPAPHRHTHTRTHTHTHTLLLMCVSVDPPPGSPPHLPKAGGAGQRIGGAATRQGLQPLSVRGIHLFVGGMGGAATRQGRGPCAASGGDWGHLHIKVSKVLSSGGGGDGGHLHKWPGSQSSGGGGDGGHLHISLVGVAGTGGTCRGPAGP